MSKILLIGFAGLMFFKMGVASAEDWIPLANTDDALWHVKPGSLEASKTKAGIDIAVVVGRYTERKTGKITLGKWYVSISDCGAGMGKLVNLKLDGSYAFESDFVVGAGSVASSIAESICGAYHYSIQNANDKSL